MGYIYVRTMKILLLLLATAMQTAAWSQNWIESYSDASISIQYTKIDFESPSDGIHHERFIFRYVNHTNQNLHLTFGRNISYNGEELAASSERTFELVLPAGSTISYDDSKKYDKTYYIFSRDHKETIQRKLSVFECINIEYEQK